MDFGIISLELGIQILQTLPDKPPMPDIGFRGSYQFGFKTIHQNKWKSVFNSLLKRPMVPQSQISFKPQNIDFIHVNQNKGLNPMFLDHEENNRIESRGN